MAWTDERIETCRKMWADGKSASEIGMVLGFSRNAIIGKIQRNGWKGPNSWTNRDTSTVKATVAKPRPRPNWTVKHKAPTAIPSPPLPPSPDAAMRSFAEDGPKTFEEADFGHECRWPLGDRDFVFCCAPTDVPPYCHQHARIAFNT